MSKRNIENIINYDFYTPNDKEVREYLVENFKTASTEDCWNGDYGYITVQRGNGSVFCYYGTYGEFIPTTEFKKLIGMEENMNKQFTKDQLVAGKHVVECNNGDRFIFIGNGVLQDVGSLKEWMDLNTYSDTLTKPNDEWSIKSVYEVVNFCHISSMSARAKLIWQREEKSQSQIELEKLQQQISELQDQAKRLEKSL